MGQMELGFLDFVHILRRWRFALLIAALCGGAIAVVVSVAMPVHYTSEALLEIQAHSSLTREMNPMAQDTTPAQVRTEVDILQSRALADNVVTSLNLAANPAFRAAVRRPTWIDWIAATLKHARAAVEQRLGIVPAASDPIEAAVRLFRQRLRVVASDKSDIVSVQFASGSPTLSAEIVNTLLTRYLAQQVAAKTSVGADERAWLNRHLDGLQRAMDEAAARAHAFRDESGQVNLQEGALPAIQLNEKEKALASAQQDLARATAAYQTAISSHDRVGFLGHEALGSLLIQRLREQEAAVLAKAANLRARGGDNSIYLPPVRAELAAIRQQIATETAKVVASLKRDVDVANSRVNTLRSEVAKAEVQARKNINAEATLSQLNQDFDAKRQVYLAALTRMEQTQLASSDFPTARVVSPAVPPSKADGMPGWLVFVLGLAAASLLAVGAALLSILIKGRIGTARDLQLLTGITPVGSIPALPQPGSGSPIPMRILDMKHSSMVETLHALRFAILEASEQKACTKLLISSSRPREGKTTLAACLARVSAASGLRVLLIEADLRRPALGSILKVPKKANIDDFLAGKATLADAIHIDPKSGLHCLLAGGSTANPVAALQSPVFDSLLSRVYPQYDLIIIDSPPVMNVIDALVVSKYCDVVLFAIASGRTSAATVSEAIRRFPSDVRSRIMTVMNMVSQSDDEWRGYYSGYTGKLLTSA